MRRLRTQRTMLPLLGSTTWLLRAGVECKMLRKEDEKGRQVEVCQTAPKVDTRLYSVTLRLFNFHQN